VTGGAYLQFNPHIERVAERLPRMFEAVTHFAMGGMPALQARGNESAVLLLEQMNAAGQIAQGTPQMVSIVSPRNAPQRKAEQSRAQSYIAHSVPECDAQLRRSRYQW
jgi:hypothetical protein